MAALRTSTRANHVSDRPQIHVVAHTHWDREWYHTAARFRQRLVELIDELLEDPALSRERPFLLDGQAIVLTDYLAVRMDRGDALRAALARGGLEAGPWYVLPDELFPSGEALVRNLLLGTRIIRLLGGDPPPVLYSPDAFGHSAALPALAAGFGMRLCIVWRGLGGVRWPKGDAFRWSSPDGSTVLTHHLPPDGYETGASIPHERGEASRWWSRRRRDVLDRATTGAVLLLNGADHHARQRHLDAALEALADAAQPHRVVRSTLRRFADAFETAARDAHLPGITGELRDSTGYTWSLQGTLGTRSGLKRGNAITERLLLRDVEPWLALSVLRGLPGRADLLRAAWRSLLECHPHDTLCGCSIDEVALAMAVRLTEARQQGRGLRERALHQLLGHEAERARDQLENWRPLLLVRNRAARARSGVAHVELTRFVRDVPVGPGSAAGPVRRGTATSLTLDPPLPLQSLHAGFRHDRTESPRHYPDNDLVEAERALVWIDDVRGCSVRTWKLQAVVGERARVGLPPGVEPARGERQSIDNGLLRAEVTPQGVLALSNLQGREHATLTFEDVGDAGDLYTHSPVGVPRVHERCLQVELVESGPLRCALRLRYDLDLPVSSSRSGRSSRRRGTRIEVHASLAAAEPFLRLAIRGVNRSRDHRLRLVLRTRLAGEHVDADSAFWTVRRSRAAPPGSPEEHVPSSAPLARHVTLRGDGAAVTVLADGLAEYEATPDGDLAVTLLRAVGALSRNDLPERPGNAGWPAPTPRAQVLGPFAARLGVLMHGPLDASAEFIEQATEDFLLPLIGSTLRSAVADYESRDFVELEGGGLAFSACKEREAGDGIVLRCVNLRDAPVAGAWHVSVPVAEAWLARLDETPGRRLEVRDNRVHFTAPPRALVTIVVKPA